VSPNELFADDRIQFYLRNQEDIKAWAAIESDVMAATRELLSGAQASIEERIAIADASAIVGRNDSGPWERIFVQHVGWPSTVGGALEWHRSVDPAGGARPKLGVFWWADPPTLVEPRSRLVTTVDKISLQSLGFKVPLEGVWPVGARTEIDPNWWRDPDGWLGRVVEQVVELWPLVAPSIDLVLAEMSSS
jgi:hypothetical protein